MGATAMSDAADGAHADVTTFDLGFLRAQGVAPEIVDGIARFRDRHPVPAALAGRVPRPTARYLGAGVWEQAAAALLSGRNVLLEGPKATGKNVLAQNLAAAFGRPEWDVSLHVDADAASLIGADTYADGRVRFRPGPIACCAAQGGLGVLDEVNMARSEALAVLHATLDDRRIIDVPGYDLISLDDATRFVATMNVGYEGTRELNEALASRFVVIAMPEPDVDQIVRLLRDRFPRLTGPAARQLATLFDEIRMKCAAGELSDRVLDLRGLIDAVALMEVGLDARRALEACVANKAFDAYERGLARDVIDARLPRSLGRGRLFERG